MSKEQYSPIRFQLEESIWLDHHSRGADIVSLELEPEIEVNEDGNYVNISGSLVLTGRFLANEDEGDETLDLESSSLAEQLHFNPLRVEQKEIVERNFNGKIEKRFPIDVTVPVQKIQSIDDVFVHVDQFDYEVYDGHRLAIQADVSITGILKEARVEAVKEYNETPEKVNQSIEEVVKAEASEVEASEAQPKEVQVKERKSREAKTKEAKVKDSQEREIQEAPPASPAFYPSFDVAASKDEVGNQEVEAPAAQSSQNETQEVIRAEANLEQQEVAVNDGEIPNAVAETNKVEASAEEVLREVEEPALEEEEQELQREDSHEEKVIPLFDNEIRTLFRSKPAPEVVEASATADGGQEERPASETASFLTSLMSGDGNEREQYARLKMCIIQKEESLELISERYEIPARDIMRVNRMTTEEVSEGQILYIPVS